MSEFDETDAPSGNHASQGEHGAPASTSDGEAGEAGRRRRRRRRRGRRGGGEGGAEGASFDGPEEEGGEPGGTEGREPGGVPIDTAPSPGRSAPDSEGEPRAERPRRRGRSPVEREAAPATGEATAVPSSLEAPDGANRGGVPSTAALSGAGEGGVGYGRVSRRGRRGRNREGGMDAGPRGGVSPGREVRPEAGAAPYPDRRGADGVRDYPPGGRRGDRDPAEGGRRSRRGLPREEAHAGPRGAISSDDRRARGARRAAHVEDSDAIGVRMPVTGHYSATPRRHGRQARAAVGMARRTRKQDAAATAAWCAELPQAILQALGRTLGLNVHAPADVLAEEIAIAVGRSHRLLGVIHQLHARDRQALGALLQCGGLAHADELHAELAHVLGGRADDWARTFRILCDKAIVFASPTVEGGFYYLVPEPLFPDLEAALSAEMTLPTFAHDEVRVVDERFFSPPIDFLVATVATYLDQRPPRLTRMQEVFKGHKEELDRFFAQVWGPDSEVFSLIFDFFVMHGMVEIRGDGMAVQHAVVEEWLQLDPEDQRNLVFRALDKRMAFAEYVLTAVHAGGGAWVPEEPLQATYRRWKRGEDWRERYHRGAYENPRTAERDSWSFSPLVNCGMLELGLWGQQKFYRLSARARALVEPPADDGFHQFYLTPSYEIMAPAGLAPLLLFRVGELAELQGCDRANTYRITEVSIERALQRGWRRDDLLDFLRDKSQIGLPENVEQTLRAWIGAGGDVEFHDLVALTVHRSAVARVEALRELRPHLVHRFAPGLYAVDRNQLHTVRQVLLASGFNPPEQPRTWPEAETTERETQAFHLLVAEARDQRNDPQGRAHLADTQPGELRPVPGSNLAFDAPRKRKSGLPRVTSTEAQAIVQRAIDEGRWLAVTYVSAKDGTRRDLVLAPERLATNREGNLVLVALDTAQQVKLTYALGQIERARTTEARGA